MTQVLVVDDSAIIRKVTRGMLESLGFTVDEAADGQQAQSRWRQGAPDAIILDWNMPVMDGIEFLKWLRAEAAGGASRVVFCTTESDFDHIQTALLAGADEYIFKPFDMETLRSKLAMAGVLP
jgi:two-component system chemotaxis response regulator CheY